MPSLRNLFASAPGCDLELEGTLDLQAAATEGSTPTFTLVANTGVPMDVGNFGYPVVIDLTGAKFAKSKTPVIMDHDTSKRIGFTTEQTVEATRIVAKGKVVSSMNVAKGFVEDAKAGFPFQVSVGAGITKREFVPEGQKAEVNGKSFQGPLIVARKSVIRELTVTVLGADGNTVAKVAASYQNSKGVKDMNFAEWLSAKGFNEADLTKDQMNSLKAMFDAETQKPPKDSVGTPTPTPTNTVEAQAPTVDLQAEREKLAAETERTGKINDLFAQYPNVQNLTVNGTEVTRNQFQASAIRDDLTPEKVELALMRADRPVDVGPAIHVTADLEGPLFSEALACSLARTQFGMKSSVQGHSDQKRYGYENQFSEQALEASDRKEFRVPSLHMLMDITCRAAGMPFHGNRKSDDFMFSYVKAAQRLEASGGPFSTLTVSNILENVANKAMLARFQMQKVAWPKIASVHTLNDFKVHSMYRLQENLGFLKVGPSGELKSGELTDSKQTLQLDTYGRLISLTRQDIRNDDLNAFVQILNGFADGMSWAVESALATLLLSMIGGSFFSTANGNLISDDLTIDGLTTAEETFSDHVGTGGKPIVAEPDRLLVGTQDAVLARQLYNDTRVVSTTAAGGFESNPHSGKYEPVKWNYLSNTALRDPEGNAFSGQDSDQWLLLADPAMSAAIRLGFLDGRSVPYIQSSETSFNTLGTQWRAFGDFGVGQGDTQAAVLSLGDGSSL